MRRKNINIKINIKIFLNPPTRLVDLSLFGLSPQLFTRNYKYCLPFDKKIKNKLKRLNCK